MSENIETRANDQTPPPPILDTHTPVFSVEDQKIWNEITELKEKEKAEHSDLGTITKTFPSSKTYATKLKEAAELERVEERGELKTYLEYIAQVKRIGETNVLKKYLECRKEYIDNMELAKEIVLLAKETIEASKTYFKCPHAKISSPPPSWDIIGIIANSYLNPLGFFLVVSNAIYINNGYVLIKTWPPK
jgi:hypothetical protein